MRFPTSCFNVVIEFTNIIFMLAHYSYQEMNSQAINDFRIQDPNLTPQITPRRSDNEIEDADLEFGDYVRMQFLGMNIDDAIETSEGLSYRSKLDWELCILDDFS